MSVTFEYDRYNTSSGIPASGLRSLTGVRQSERNRRGMPRSGERFVTFVEVALRNVSGYLVARHPQPGHGVSMAKIASKKLQNQRGVVDGEAPPPNESAREESHLDNKEGAKGLSRVCARTLLIARSAKRSTA